MGFAVVADEVRNLAQRSVQAAKETQSTIENSSARARETIQCYQQITGLLEGNEKTAQQITKLAGEIATAAREQSNGISQINTAVSQMDKVTQENAANAEETASAAEELNAQTGNLQEAVADLMSIVGGMESPKNESPSTPPQARMPRQAPAPRLILDVAPRSKSADKELLFS